MKKLRLLSGSYTNGDIMTGARGEGIHVWDFDTRAGKLKKISTFAEISNPLWIIANVTSNLIGVASEHIGGKSKVGLLEMSREGKLRILDEIDSGDAT